MSEAVQITLIQQLPAIVTALLTGLAALLIVLLRLKIAKLHKDVNGRMDQLVDAAKAQGRDEIVTTLPHDHAGDAHAAQTRRIEELLQKLVEAQRT